MRKPLALAMLLALIATAPALADTRPAPAAPPVCAPRVSLAEGPAITPQVTAGPFELARKYRSMEGPYASIEFRVGDLFASRSVTIPESMVQFVELGNRTTTGSYGSPQGLVRVQDEAPDLYWLKGLKMEVLDENGDAMRTGEFMCHYNLDVVPAARNKAFPQGESCKSTRLISLTQGQMDIRFPEGFAVPVSSDEVWKMAFQAANRTSKIPRRVKHRLTVYLIKDSDLLKPVKALGWYVPYVAVVVEGDTKDAASTDKDRHPQCHPIASAVDAPNNVSGGVWKDRLGRRLSGHWVVPPGKHTYAEPIRDERDPGFSTKDRSIHAVWSHIHPLCTRCALRECHSSGGKKLFEIKVRNSTTGEPVIDHIDFVSSTRGFPVVAGRHYQMEATYNNNTGAAIDSMISMGIFFADESFRRPAWATKRRDSITCNVPPPSEPDQEEATKQSPR